MALLGMTLCGISVGFFRRAQFGVDPFQCFCGGAANVITLDFGTLYVLINLVLLAVDFFRLGGFVGGFFIFFGFPRIRVFIGGGTIVCLRPIIGNFFFRFGRFGDLAVQVRLDFPSHDLEVFKRFHLAEGCGQIDEFIDLHQNVCEKIRLVLRKHERLLRVPRFKPHLGACKVHKNVDFDTTKSQCFIKLSAKRSNFF